MSIVISARSSTAWIVHTLRTLICISLVFASHAQLSCLRDSDIMCQTCEAGPEYDMSTNCTTCVEPRLDPSTGCSECTEGETQCYTGNFTFSALFHSYMNPQHLCGECVEKGPVCCDTDVLMDNCVNNCDFRLLFFVQPYEAAALDVEFPFGGPDYLSDIIFMFPQGPNAFPVTNRANPYTVELTTWTERLQFYIVLYDFNSALGSRFALDRFLINLELGGVPSAIGRQTYHGIYNIAHFDLSFNIRCSANYYGPRCSIFCYEVEVSTCDAMGNIICTNPSCAPSNDCLVCTTTTTSTTTSHNPAGSSSSRLLGGVIGAILAVILILILLSILLFIICRKRKLKYETGKCEVVTSMPRTFNDRDKSAVETVECVAYGEVSTVNPAVVMDECVAYGHVSTLEHTSQVLLPADTETADYDYIQ